MTPPTSLTAPGKLYLTWRLAGAHCHWGWERAVAEGYRLETPQAIRNSWIDVPIQVPSGACVSQAVLEATVQQRVAAWNAARTASGRPGLVVATLHADGCIYRDFDDTQICINEFALTVDGGPWTVPDPDDTQAPAVLSLTYEYSVPLP